MKNIDNSGGGMVSILFALLFIVSVALNAILLVGCDTLTGGGKPGTGGIGGVRPGSSQPRPTVAPEAVNLMEIAKMLGIDETPDKTPDNIAFLIKQRLGETVRYRGRVLSDENAEDVKAQILEQSDAETFAEYHDFITRRIADKKILILE